MSADFAGARRAAVFALGCRVNHSEAAMMADELERAGWRPVSFSDSAPLLILNSCALTEFAEAKTRRAIKAFKRRNPGARVCAAGCYAQTSPGALAAAGADIVVPNTEKAAAVRIALDMMEGRDVSRFAPEPACGGGLGAFRAGGGVEPDPGFSAGFPVLDRMGLKIQDGCDNACAYCIIPRARGGPRSRTFSEIMRDAENLVSRGVREITLTGINMSKFDGSLAALADALDGIDGLYRVSLGSLEPPVPEFEALVERMADPSHKLARHFHISLQSASDTVLRRMRRSYSVSDFFSAVDFAKGADAGIGIGTDIICGFPGEGEAEFGETLRNISSSGLSFLHVFTYSPRPGTAAAREKPEALSVRKARADRLRREGRALLSRFIASLEGAEDDMLLEKPGPGGVYPGYLSNYVPARVEIPEKGLRNALARVRVAAESPSGGSARAELERIVFRP